MRTFLSSSYRSQSKEDTLSCPNFALIYDPCLLAKLLSQLQKMIWEKSDLYTREEDALIGKIMINKWCNDALAIAETALVLKIRPPIDLDYKYLHLLDSFKDKSNDTGIIKFFSDQSKTYVPIIRKARMFFQEEDCVLKIASQHNDCFSFTLSRNESIEKWCQDQKIKCCLLEKSAIFDPISESLDQTPSSAQLAANFVDYFISILNKENLISPPDSLAWLYRRVHLSSALISRYLTHLLDKTLPSQFMISCPGNISEQTIAYAMSYQGKSVIASDHGLGFCTVENDYFKLHILSGAQTFISYNSLSCEEVAPFLLHNRHKSDDIFPPKIGDTSLFHINSSTRKKKLKRTPMKKSSSIIFEPFFSATEDFFLPSHHLHPMNSTQLNRHMLACLISLEFKITLRPHLADDMPLLNKLVKHFGSYHVRLSRSNMESICDWHDFVIMTDSTTTAMKTVLSSGKPFIIFDCHAHRMSDFAKRAFNSHGLYKEVHLSHSLHSQISVESIKSDIDVALERTSCQDPFWF